MQNRYTGDVGDFAKYGLMRQFNDAGFRMALYEQKQIDWNGTKRFFKGMAADPTTYVGLSTLGLGAIMGASAKQATKAGIVAALKAELPTTAVAAIEGEAFTSFDDAMLQEVTIEAGAGSLLGAELSIVPEMVRSVFRTTQPTE